MSNIVVDQLQSLSEPSKTVSMSEVVDYKTRIFNLLRRSYAEAGYNMVDGSFEEGGTLASTSDVLLHKASGIAYSWSSTFPKVVSAGSTPATTGGVGAGGGFTNRSGEMLRASVLKVTRSYPLDVTDYLPAGYVTDGSVDYIHIIKQVIDLAAGVRPVLMPNFPVLVDPARAGFGVAGILVPSNSNIIFQQNSKLLTKPNSLNGYEILSLRDVSNVTIYRPFVVGDKYTHTGTTGEHGHGIVVRGACKNINIIEPETNELWGDGIYIGQTVDTVESTPENVTITKPIGRRNRRQGMSITSVNGLTVTDPQWWDTKSSDCPTPLQAGPHAGVDIEPNSVNSLLRGIKFSGVRGGGNDGGLFYTFLGIITTAPGDVYHVDINVDSITDDGSKFALTNKGVNKNSMYSGAISVGSIISKNAQWNGIMHRNIPVACGLAVNIGYASISNWASDVGLAARHRTPVVVYYEGGGTAYPTIGNLHIGRLDLRSTIPAENLSVNAVFFGASTPGTLSTPAFDNVKINFGLVSTPKPLRIEGSPMIELGLNSSFGSQLKHIYNGSTSYQTNVVADVSIEPTGSSSTLTLPNTYPAELEGNRVRFSYTPGGTAKLARLRSPTVPMYLNGVIATNVTFTETAGIVTMTFRNGSYYLKADGPITKEN
jgi:hypothetical protein